MPGIGSDYRYHVAVLLRGLRMPIRAALLLLAGLPASAASSQQQQASMLAALPHPFRRQLLHFHEIAKPNAGKHAWTVEQDANILMQVKLGADLDTLYLTMFSHLESSGGH